jgi:hypothetical protein
MNHTLLKTGHIAAAPWSSGSLVRVRTGLPRRFVPRRECFN